MSYALIDIYNAKWIFSVKTLIKLNEFDIFVPPFPIRDSKKFAKKVLKILNKNQVKSVVLSNRLLQNKIFCEELFNNHKEIITRKENI